MTTDRVRELAERIGQHPTPDAYTIGLISGTVRGVGPAQQKLARIAEVLEALRMSRHAELAGGPADPSPAAAAARRHRERQHQQRCGTCGTQVDWVSSTGLCDACLVQQGAAR